MLIMARAASRMGICTDDTALRLEQVLHNFGLPVTTPYRATELAAAALADKKRKGNEVTLVVPEKMGKCVLSPDSGYGVGALLRLWYGGTHMSTFVVYPGSLAGTVRAISSKSDAHRNLICAAFADGSTVFDPFTPSNDIDATMDCLTALGASFAKQEDGGVTVIPGRPSARTLLDCGESGSTLRFLLPVTAALGSGASFTGRGRLPQRRIAPLLDVIAAHGCTLSADRLPLTVADALRREPMKLWETRALSTSAAFCLQRR